MAASSDGIALTKTIIRSDVGTTGSVRSTGVGEVASGGLRTESIVVTLELLAQVEGMSRVNGWNHRIKTAKAGCPMCAGGSMREKPCRSRCGRC